MAIKSKLFEFDTKIAGADRVKVMMQTAIAATGAVLGSKVISKKILKMHQDRFAPKGTNPRAQKDPDGNPWAPLKLETLKRAKNTNTSQALVDKGKLLKAIVIARDTLRNATRVGTGHADIAVRRVQNRRKGKDGRIDVRYTDEYAKVHQYGGGVSNAPARPFMGIGKPDALEIEEYMTTTLNKFFVNFS